MKQVQLIFAASILISLLTMCGKGSPQISCMPPPPKISMRIIDKNTSQDLLYSKTYSIDTVQVYYLGNNQPAAVSLSFEIDTVHKKVFINSYDWCQKSLNGIKVFYLKLNSHDVDTAALDVVKRIGSAPCPDYVFNKFEINGEKITVDTVYHSDVYRK